MTEPLLEITADISRQMGCTGVSKPVAGPAEAERGA